MTNEEIVRLESYMRARFHLDTIEVRQHPSNPDLAELYISEDHVGEFFKDTDEGELSYDFSMNFHTDADQLQAYMQDRFKLDSIEVRQRVNKDDSAEVYIADEFIGVLFEEDDVHSYAFNMSILDYDLAEA